MRGAEIHLRKARYELMAAQEMLTDDIRTYPTPIAGCDEQFNHLMAERSRVTAALDRLDAAIFVPTPRRLEP